MATLSTINTGTSSSGAVVEVVIDKDNNGGADVGIATNFNCTVVATGIGKAGDVTIEVKVCGGEYEPILDSLGSPITIDIASPVAVVVNDVAATSFRFTPVGFANVESYTATVCGW